MPRRLKILFPIVVTMIAGFVAPISRAPDRLPDVRQPHPRVRASWSGSRRPPRTSWPTWSPCCWASPSASTHERRRLPAPWRPC
ncbi:MAG: hypothetical protein M0C28_48495 [Candidatus Moduliflexus flocculans]|nr:hypothetical protein [Candidatus Moduliflexus flocculans]